MLNDVIRHSSKVAIASNFIAVDDKTKCTNCGNCVERCHFNAREMKNEILHYNHKNCVGCGLCISSCEDEAITLTKRINSIA
jgi:MinD superfamily P-loop ATPase